MVQFAREQPQLLSFRSQLYRRGICFLPALATADSSRGKPRFGMTNPLEISTCTGDNETARSALFLCDFQAGLSPFERIFRESEIGFGLAGL